MNYATISVHVSLEDSFPAQRVALAADLAQRHGSVLIGLAAATPHPPPVEPFGASVFAGEIIVEEEERIRASLSAAEQRFLAGTRIEGLAVTWKSFIDLPGPMLAREACNADLLVIGRDRNLLREGEYVMPDPAHVIISAGRPVLVVPPGTEKLAADTILVAWKNTRECRRAVRDAIPLLRTARQVCVLEIADEKQGADVGLREVVQHLRGHGVEARAELRERREVSTAAELVLAAEQLGSDLIVAGCYGHSRLREWAFGGVTRDLLRQCPKCCLLSH